MSRGSVYVCAALGGVLFGYDTAVVNGALFQLQQHFSLDANSTVSGLIVSIAVAGAFIGAFGGGLLASMFGRRKVLATADILFVCGSTMLCLAPSVSWILGGRALVGVGIGISSIVVPVYLAEVTNPMSRGRVISINSVCICGSQFVASAVCGLFVHYASPSTGWRWMFGIGIVPAALQLVAIGVFLPESPRWLQSQGQLELAASVASKYGIDLAVVQDTHQRMGEFEQYRHVFSSEMRRRLLLGIGLQALQQFSGINTVMYYSADILKSVGFKGDEAPVLLSIPLAFINALFTLIAMVYADHLGRRKLLLVSLVGCGFATCGMTIFGALQSADVMSQSFSGWVFVALLAMYLMFFAPGLGAMPWLIMSEIYPTQVRSCASGVATMANWGSNAVVSQSFPLLVGSIGVGPTFGIIAAIELIGFFVVRRVVPETKGLSLEEIDDLFCEVGVTSSLVNLGER